MWLPQGSVLGPNLFLIYVNDTPQTLKSTLLLYADGSYILYQHKEVDEIEKQIKTENICNWFVDSKLSIHFGKDKAKSILFASKQRLQNVRQLDLNL